MPKQFKSMATIAVWVLFIFGLVMLVGAIIAAVISMTGVFEGMPVKSSIEFSVAVLSITLSVVVMRMRQKME
jgi:hypothetical protein